jgi:hypothetical protein
MKDLAGKIRGKLKGFDDDNPFSQSLVVMDDCNAAAYEAACLGVITEISLMGIQ